MLSGLKFISRDEIEKAQDEDLGKSKKGKKKSGTKKDRARKKKRRSHAHGSSSEDDLERISKGSRKKKKWYASDEDVSSSSGGSESDYEEGRREEKAAKKRTRENDCLLGGDNASRSNNFDGISRKEMGLEWMIRPKDNTNETPATAPDNSPEEVQAVAQDIKKVDPRELNPYLKDNGIGYPEDLHEKGTGSDQLLSSSLVGDGGASWRLKALKRAREQAAREGRKLNEVVEERWGSVGDLTVSLASHKAAPTHAHLHAIKSRRRGVQEEDKTSTDKRSEKSVDQDGSSRRANMRVPKVPNSLSWGKRRISTEDESISAAMSSINKFSDDGSFLREFMSRKSDDSSGLSKSSNTDVKGGLELECLERKSEDSASTKPSLSANQLAAKVLQLRMKGKHEEAEKILKESENTKVKPDAGDEPYKPCIDGSTSRYIMHGVSAREKRKEDDPDLHLAQSIMRNQVTNRADDEYDYDDGPRRTSKKKRGSNDNKSSELTKHANRFLLQQDRCQFCFENPTRPKHLVIAIANFAYLSLPHWEPVVPGHCCILTMQHESATRSVDDNVWDEIRNFKKCLIMMFGQQDKDLVFIETVMGLSQQRRHCVVECIPLPREVARQAPVYFKKAIDEAEDEWSQHNAKKLIDTSEKGLRASIPKNFPYFHVEFGLKKGFVHVIDDEKEFKSNFGLNVIRGILRLPAEDMHRRRKHESVEVQKLAVAKFVKDWQPFDWTKQLD